MSTRKTKSEAALLREQKEQMRIENAKNNLQARIQGEHNPEFTLCSVERRGVTYSLIKNGEVRYSGMAAPMIRVPMRPSDNGHVYELEEGVLKLVKHILTNREINNNKKFYYCSKLAAEYYGNKAVLDAYRELTRGLKSPDEAYKLTDWEVLLNKKKQQYQEMVDEVSEKEERNRQKIAEIKQMFVEA